LILVPAWMVRRVHLGYGGANATCAILHPPEIKLGAGVELRERGAFMTPTKKASATVVIDFESESPAAPSFVLFPMVLLTRLNRCCGVNRTRNS
jgi:hypothetical protein